MTIVQLLLSALLLVLGVVVGSGREDSQSKEAPTPGPKYSYMGHVLSLLCTVINDQPPGGTPNLMIFLTN